ncbi:MAG: OprO/OprP family phosphate-selective porin, partial [Bacteroidales bacterium]|nr:OprO/OprP family phosphate-selective porin [Bacteroidales bacterium]
MSSICLASEDGVVQQFVPAQWYNKIKINGYMQLRYNDLYKTNPAMENPQGDRTYGGYDGFSLRRMRMKISGQIHPRVYFYFQADFASDGINLGQLRDAYFDYFLDRQGEWKLRGGQSKIPFGFENLQSSQNRLALDRNDPLNSAVKDERDMNIGIHYAPKKIRDRLITIRKKGLKGSGDYGMAYLMLYNGQRGNRIVPEYNDYDYKMPHIAMRFSYPFELASGQFIEVGVQGYTGQYVMSTASDGVVLRHSDGTLSNRPVNGELFRDRRVAASLVYYPQPFGFQAEYNLGVGPEFAYDSEKEIGSIGNEKLNGGYAQVMYRIQHKGQEI